MKSICAVFREGFLVTSGGVVGNSRSPLASTKNAVKFAERMGACTHLEVSLRYVLENRSRKSLQAYSSKQVTAAAFP